LFISSSHNLHSVASCQLRNINGLAEDKSCRLRPPSLLRRGSKGFFREDPLSNRRPRKQRIYITNVRTSAEERVDLPQVRKKKIHLHSTRTRTSTSGLLRFSKLDKQPASKNSVYLTRNACSKMMLFTVCKVLKRSWKTWIDSLSLNYYFAKLIPRSY